MKRNNEFIILSDVLMTYFGQGGNIVIPDGVIGFSDRGAFKGNQDVTSVTIPRGVKFITHNTFSDCTNLRSVFIPDTVEAIGYNAFKNCESLTSIVLPESVKRIDEYAFYGCKNLQRITILGKLEKIGKGAFRKCALHNKDGWIIFDDVLYDYVGKGTAVEIPQGVKRIAPSAFKGLRRITEVVIPDSVEVIDDEVLRNCAGLNKVTVRGAVKELGARAFGGCYNIDSIVLPEGVNGFDDTVLELLWSRFSAIGYKTLIVTALLEQYFDKIVASYELKKKIKTGKKALLDRIIRTNNARLLERFFSLYRRISVDELDSLIVRSESAAEVKAFLIEYKRRCYSQEKLDEIENDRIEKAFGLKKKNVADYRKEYRFSYGVDGITITQYIGKESIVEVPARIGNKDVVEIGRSAFYGCDDIERVYISDGINRIDFKAFSNCKNLVEVVIGEGITKIPIAMFDECVSLSSVILPKSVNEICTSAFRGCRNLTHIELPENVTRIEGEAFEGCEALVDIKFSDNLQYIGEHAFAYCRSLSVVNLPSSVRQIGVEAFRDCKQLVEINIPDSLIHFGSNVFLGCDKIADINELIVGGVLLRYKKPANNALSSEGGRMIAIPDSVRKIEKSVFSKLRDIISVSLPDTVQEIDMRAFDGCDKLEEVVGARGLRIIGAWAFCNCSALKAITLPDTLVDIGVSAFDSCHSLESVVIPGGVSKISGWTFWNCRELKSVVIRDGVEEIGSHAFGCCTRLDSIEIPASVTVFNDGVLKNCPNVTICAPRGSRAEAYARQNRIRFKAI